MQQHVFQTGDIDVTTDEDKPPSLRLVSENADRDIQILHAKQLAKSLLADLAAAVLRTAAGSGSAAPIMPIVFNLVVAQSRLEELSGSLLAIEEERQTLALPPIEGRRGDSDRDYREFEYSAGLEKVVNGALRLAAHQILKEREHFGGKYSTLAIEEGIKLIVRATAPLAKRRRKSGKPAIE